MVYQLRAARRAELPQICDLLAEAFDEAAPEVFRAQTERDSTFRLRHARVAVDSGEVLGYVRIFARTMMVAGVPSPAGGIGSVATRAAHRGRGIATALMEDAIAEMRRHGMRLSFLFTGIPAFYERLGYRVVSEPYFEAAADQAAAVADPGLWDVRALEPVDEPKLLAVHRRAVAGTTGAVLRTLRTWRDAQTWLDEDPGGCFVAERTGVIAGYVRSRCRSYGHQILEAETAPGHEGALPALLAAVARRATAHGEPLVALVPPQHALAALLRTLPGTVVDEHFRHPMMVLPFDDDTASAFRRQPVRFWNSDRI